MNKQQAKFLGKVVSGLLAIIMIAKMAWEAQLPTPVVALYAASLAGLFTKVMVPFVRKIQEGKIQRFDPKYFWTIMVTFLYLVPLNMTIVEAIDVSGMSWKAAALVGFLTGLGANWGTEELFRYLRMFKRFYREIASTGGITADGKLILFSDDDSYNLRIDYPSTEHAAVETPETAPIKKPNKVEIKTRRAE